MFKHMEIAESIYEGVVEPSYLKNYYVRRQPCSSQDSKERRSRLITDLPQVG